MATCISKDLLDFPLTIKNQKQRNEFKHQQQLCGTFKMIFDSQELFGMIWTVTF
jgi:hypothetical protein